MPLEGGERTRAQRTQLNVLTSSASVPTFSERLTARRHLWWDRPTRRRGQGLGDVAHWLRDKHTFRSREDQAETWRCCPYWQRTLIQKWNSREFASKYGCRVPELYWHGGPFSRPPLESLPDHFVVRPVRGAARRGVLVVSGGRELLRDESATDSELRTELSRLRRLRYPRRLSYPTAILIEEFVREEDGGYRLPLEYKCHVFGESVAAISVTERTGMKTGKLRFYTPGWEPCPDPMNVELPQAEIRDPPACLEEMLRQASTLGAQLQTYMRIDFFATDRGCVFNEFASLPGDGLGWTPYCNDLFGALWAERFPDAA
jgi:teichuronopeptide biosynthesis TupA-like protein